MSKNKTLQALEQLLRQKKSNQFYAEKLGISEAEVRDLKRQLYEEKKDKNEAETSTINHNIDKGTLEVNAYYKEPPTPEQIIEDYKIDNTKWKLSNFWSKACPKGWLVSAYFSQKPQEEKVGQEFMEFLKNYKPQATSIKEQDLKINNDFRSKSCALISLPDAHLDKLTIDKSSIEDQIKAYNTVLEALVKKAYNTHNLEEIVFVIGNDFVHTDSIHNTTTKGTPLEVNTTWFDAYEKGFSLLVDSISKLKHFCKTLTVVLVPGNHSKTKEYYMGHALEVFFKNDKNIVFKRGQEDLKVHKYGETLFCFSHGNNINDKLPLTFATNFYKEWGNCKYKEIILGDKHHNSEKLFRAQGETNGIRMRILPSISGTDTWHQDNLFVGAIQSGICMVYDKEKGKISEFEERV